MPKQLNRPHNKREAQCPYCDKAFSTWPKQSKKCPYCKAYIIRGTRSGPLKEGELYTEEAASAMVRRHWHKVFRDRHKEQLPHWRRMGIRHVKIIASRESCEVCKRLDGTSIPIDEAIRRQPLPAEACKDDYCHCTYVPIARSTRKAKKASKAERGCLGVILLALMILTVILLAKTC